MIIADLLDSNSERSFSHPSAGYDWVARIRVDDDGGVEICGDEKHLHETLSIEGWTSGLNADGTLGEQKLSFAEDPERWLRDSGAIFRTGYIFFTVYADSHAEAAEAERHAVEDLIIAAHPDDPSWGEHIGAQRAAAAQGRLLAAKAREVERTEAMLAAADAATIEERMLLPWTEPVHEGASLSTKARAHWKMPGTAARG